MLGGKARAERRAQAEADRLGALADRYAQQAGEQPSDDRGPEPPGTEGEEPDAKPSAGPYGTWGHQQDTDLMLAGLREGDAEEAAQMAQSDLEAG